MDDEVDVNEDVSVRIAGVALQDASVRLSHVE